MSSIKQLIINAIIKVSGENPALNVPGQVSAQEARDEFIRALLAELFPEDTMPPLEKIPENEPVPVPVPVPDPAPEPVPESEGKKKRAPMSEEAKAAMKAKREATLAAKGKASAPDPVLEEGEVVEPVKEKKTKKTKPAEDANVAKIDPTWRKYIKNVDKKFPKEKESELLKYLNGLSKDDFNAKKGEEHVADFLAQSAQTDDGKVETDLIVVDFNGKEYYVNPETKRVYEGEGVCDAEGNWTNYKGVGYVGMSAFAEMKIE